MIDPQHVPQVAPDEALARYILHNSHIRRCNGTLKPDAFIPHPHQELSVTHHLAATEQELWTVGEGIAASTGKTLYGRGDVQASTYLTQRLAVKAAPVPANPNHADVAGWPADKSTQKIIAMEISAAATFVENG